MPDRVDLEPVFFAPFVSSVMRVEPAWIDYNGHLNMAYYNVLFDRAVDEAFELLGCGIDYVKTQRHSCFTAEVHVRYLRELNAGDPARLPSCGHEIRGPVRPWLIPASATPSTTPRRRRPCPAASRRVRARPRAAARSTSPISIRSSGSQSRPWTGRCWCWPAPGPAK